MRIILALFAAMVVVPAFAGGNHGQGGQGKNVTVQGFSTSSSTATGGVRETFSHGGVSGTNLLVGDGVKAGASFQSGFTAESSGHKGFGTATSGGKTVGGLSLRVKRTQNTRMFSGEVAEHSSAGASGGERSANTWNNGVTWGSAQMHRGNGSVESFGESGHSAEDWSTKAVPEAFSKGASVLKGGVSIH